MNISRLYTLLLHNLCKNISLINANPWLSITSIISQTQTNNEKSDYRSSLQILKMHWGWNSDQCIDYNKSSNMDERLGWTVSLRLGKWIARFSNASSGSFPLCPVICFYVEQNLWMMIFFGSTKRYTWLS